MEEEKCKCEAKKARHDVMCENCWNGLGAWVRAEKKKSPVVYEPKKRQWDGVRRQRNA